MGANDQVVGAKELESQLEAKFMEILSIPDVVIPADEIDGELSEEQRATLQSVLEAQMPSPEEIQQSIEIAKHNEEVRMKRAIRLAKRRVKQQRRGKRKRGQ